MLGTEGFVMAVLATSLSGGQFREGLAVHVHFQSHLQEKDSRMGEEGNTPSQNLSLEVLSG